MFIIELILTLWKGFWDGERRVLMELKRLALVTSVILVYHSTPYLVKDLITMRIEKASLV
jgi:hypothetical protein